MRVGKTIGGKRERAETESERFLYREKVKRKKLISVATYLAVIAVIVAGVLVAIRGVRRSEVSVASETETVSPTVEITDEASVGVPRKVRDFVGYLEQDLKEYGIMLSRAVLPRDKTREVDVYVNDFSGYFKLSLDRGAGVSAEDMDRMIRYLRGQGITGVDYVDLRVEGKGYYAGATHGDSSSEEESSSVFVREGELNEGTNEAKVWGISDEGTGEE